MNMQFAKTLLENFTYEGQEKALEMFTDDGVFEDFTFGFRMEGREQLTSLFEGFFDPSQMKHKFTALDYKGNEQGGAIEYTWDMETKEFMGVPTNGKIVNLRGTMVITLRDGKVTSLIDYYDAANQIRKLKENNQPIKEKGITRLLRNLFKRKAS
jgi:steroid delta-isomerase-like uncharacterized protein